MAREYYQILGVPKTATNEQIKKAYRKLAMQYHPDRNPGKEKWANDKFKEINEAFSVLGDPGKRRQYDQVGKVGKAGDIFGSRYTRTTFEDMVKDFGGSGLGLDFLDAVFGDYLKSKGFSPKTFSQQSGRPKGVRFDTKGMDFLEEILKEAQRPRRQDVRYEVTVTREQAARGLEKDLVRKGKKLRVKIPAGVKTGTQLKLRNARQTTDGQPGDIIIVVKVH